MLNADPDTKEQVKYLTQKISSNNLKNNNFEIRCSPESTNIKFEDSREVKTPECKVPTRNNLQFEMFASQKMSMNDIGNVLDEAQLCRKGWFTKNYKFSENTQDLEANHKLLNAKDLQECLNKNEKSIHYKWNYSIPRQELIQFRGKGFISQCAEIISKKVVLTKKIMQK